MIQIDMDMPKSCIKCQFCVQKYAADEDDCYGDMCLAMTYRYDDDRLVNHYEDENGDYIDFNIETGRHPDCPLHEVKTGHWIHLSKGDKCSACGYETGRFESESNYCPGCGTKMFEPQERYNAQ